MTKINRRAFFRRAGAMATVFPPLVAGAVATTQKADTVQQVEETQVDPDPGMVYRGDGTWADLGGYVIVTINGQERKLTTVADDIKLLSLLG